MVILKLNPEDIFKDPEAKAEFLAWAMSDSDFLESFVGLIATGWSPEMSHPAYLDEIREKLHTAMGDDYHADAMKRVQEAEFDAKNARAETWRVEYRLKKIKELMPRVFSEAAGHTLKHTEGWDKQSCPACQFIGHIRGED